MIKSNSFFRKTKIFGKKHKVSHAGNQPDIE